MRAVSRCVSWRFREAEHHAATGEQMPMRLIRFLQGLALFTVALNAPADAATGPSIHGGEIASGMTRASASGSITGLVISSA